MTFSLNDKWLLFFFVPALDNSEPNWLQTIEQGWRRAFKTEYHSYCYCFNFTFWGRGNGDTIISTPLLKLFERSNDKRLSQISFVPALDNPKPKRTPFFVFMKRGYFQTRKFLLLSQKTRSKVLFEIFSIVCLLVFTLELMLLFPM